MCLSYQFQHTSFLIIVEEDTKKTENPSLTPLFWSMPNLSQLTFSMMIQINAFTSAQAVKLATDSKTSYEGLEASRISKITLPNFTNHVDTIHENASIEVEVEHQCF